MPAASGATWSRANASTSAAKAACDAVSSRSIGGLGDCDTTATGGQEIGMTGGVRTHQPENFRRRKAADLTHGLDEHQPRVEQRKALAHRVGLRLRAGLRRDDCQIAAGLPRLGQARSKKRGLDASAPELRQRRRPAQLREPVVDPQAGGAGGRAVDAGAGSAETRASPRSRRRALRAARAGTTLRRARCRRACQSRRAPHPATCAIRPAAAR